MNRSLFFLGQDLKLTWRERSNRVFLFLPPLFFILLHTAVPAILEAYPIVQDYGMVLLSGFVIQGGILFSFVSGFMLLDEKDQGIFPVFQVSPAAMTQLLLLKLAIPFLITLLYALLCLAVNPIHSFSGISLLLTAVAYALLTPSAALLIAALGKNKVEGLTYFKGLDMLFLAPILTFFIPEVWKYAFMILPTYWTFQAGALGAEAANGEFFLHAGVSLAFQSAMIVFSLWFFKRRL